MKVLEKKLLTPHLRNIKEEFATVEKSKTYIQNDYLMGAPNGGKCPHCKDGYLYWNREDEYGAQYYKCGKCGSEVKV